MSASAVSHKTCRCFMMLTDGDKSVLEESGVKDSENRSSTLTEVTREAV